MILSNIKPATISVLQDTCKPFFIADSNKDVVSISRELTRVINHIGSHFSLTLKPSQVLESFSRSIGFSGQNDCAQYFKADNRPLFIDLTNCSIRLLESDYFYGICLKSCEDSSPKDSVNNFLMTRVENVAEVFVHQIEYYFEIRGRNGFHYIEDYPEPFRFTNLNNPIKEFHLFDYVKYEHLIKSTVALTDEMHADVLEKHKVVMGGSEDDPTIYLIDTLSKDNSRMEFSIASGDEIDLVRGRFVEYKNGEVYQSGSMSAFDHVNNQEFRNIIKKINRSLIHLYGQPYRSPSYYQ